MSLNSSGFFMQNIPTENLEQEKLANYLRAHNYIFYKSPSETWTSSWRQKRKNKLEWVTKGFPDTTIILKRWSLLFIELKRQKRILKNGKFGASPSVVSKEQVKWQKELSCLDNIESLICYGADEAIEKIKELEDF